VFFYHNCTERRERALKYNAAKEKWREEQGDREEGK
jgi:hypothetical protein